MPSFIIHFSVSNASPEDEANLQTNLAKVGFTTIVASGNNLAYRLPPWVFCCHHLATKDQVLNCTKRVAFRERKRCSILITEVVGSAWVGLEMIGRERARSAAAVFPSNPGDHLVDPWTDTCASTSLASAIA
jgi:hypothetical protein